MFIDGLQEQQLQSLEAGDFLAADHPADDFSHLHIRSYTILK
jgi:hypothetical protein